MNLFNKLQLRITIIYTCLLLISIIIVNRVETIFAITTILVFMALINYLAHRHANSIKSIVKYIQQIEMNTLDTPLRISGTSGTKELAESLKKTIDSLNIQFNDLSNQHKKLSLVLDTMTDGVILLDNTGHVSMSNPAAQDLLEISLGDRRRFIEVIRDHDLQQIILDCQKSQLVESGEVALNNTKQIVNIVAIPLIGTSVEEVLLILRDLTQLRNIETTRREFVANVSHELRTPLTSMKASAESLESGITEPEIASKFLKQISDDVDHMNHIVSDLLELSRMDTGQISLNLPAVNVGDFVLMALERHLVPAKAKNISLNTTIPPNLPTVTIDTRRFLQVIQNLLDNAIKFTPRNGSVHINSNHGTSSVKISIVDTGIGIAQEDRPRIFERFYKADRSRHEKGIGLGLAIAKHIVQLHNGELSVDVNEPAGSIFTITLPIHSAHLS